MEKTTWTRFGADYISEHFGENRPLAVQQAIHNLYRHNAIPLPRLIISSMDLNGTESVLDIGCGNGMILRELVPIAKNDAKIEGIDISQEMVSLAQQAVKHHWGNIRVRKMNAYSVSENFNEKFDRVMANFIFHYIERPDEFCNVMSQVTKQDGMATVAIEGRFSMPEMYYLNEIAMHHAGFSNEEIRSVPSTRRGLVTKENAMSYLIKYFSSVAEIPYHDHLTFDSVDAYMEFYVDGHKCCGIERTLGAKGIELIPDVIEYVGNEVDRRIHEFGFFEISKRISVFQCQSPIHE